MRVLQVHNYYKSAVGGEEAMLDGERELLRSRGHCVDRFEVSNESAARSPLQAGVETIWSPRSYREMRAAIREVKPEVVHVHNTFARLSPSVYWAAAAEKVPVVQTLHNYRLTCANGLLMKHGLPCELCVDRALHLPALRYKCYRGYLPATGAVVGMQQLNRSLGTYRNKVDVYVTPTEFARSTMIRAGLPSARVQVKPNFISDPLLHRQFVHERDKQVLFVGRIAYEKGVDLLLEAWKAAQFSDARLIVLGDGAERKGLMHKFADLRAVEWTGWLHREEVLREISRSRYIVMPSRWYEVFPLVLLEALAVGTPVIAPNHGGFPDIVSRGKDGMLFEPNNEPSLSETLLYALGLDESSWKLLSDNARASYLKRFTPEANYPVLMNIYAQALQHIGESR